MRGARAALLLAGVLGWPGAARAAEIKLATWNLDWLTLRGPGDPRLPADVRPRAAGDFVALRAAATRLDADVVALEEVDGPQAAARVLPADRYAFAFTRQDVVQRVGLAVRRGIAVRQNPDVTALDVEPAAARHRLRHGLDATLVWPDGAALRVLVVHLKTGCHRGRLSRRGPEECRLLRAQLAPLAEWVRQAAAAGGAFAVLGDFNRVFDRAEEMGRALDRAAKLVRVTAGKSDPCWEGGAFIDHIFLGGPARDWLVPGSLRVMTYQAGGPAPALPVARGRHALSDHCPVSVRLAVP